MSKLIVFGAGGRAGRTIVDEAVRRGHTVTAVVRDPAKYPDLERPGVEVAQGDVTDAESTAALAKDHDAIINATANLAVPFADFFSSAARSTLAATAAAGVPRLVAIGLASHLETASGTRLMDTPGHPQEYRDFVLGHEAGLRVLQESGEEVDWVVISPSGDFDHEGTRTGAYRLAPGDMTSRITYPALATAVLDEIESPTHHHTHIGIEQP